MQNGAALDIVVRACPETEDNAPVGTWMRYSCASPASGCIYGALSMVKAKCRISWLSHTEIAARLFNNVTIPSEEILSEMYSLRSRSLEERFLRRPTAFRSAASSRRRQLHSCNGSVAKFGAEVVNCLCRLERGIGGGIVLWTVRWYCRYPISYRDLETMMTERGVAVDHSTIYRWVQHFAPEMEKRLRWQWRRPQSWSRRIDETLSQGPRQVGVPVPGGGQIREHD